MRIIRGQMSDTARGRDLSGILFSLSRIGSEWVPTRSCIHLSRFYSQNDAILAPHNRLALSSEFKQLESEQIPAPRKNIRQNKAISALPEKLRWTETLGTGNRRGCLLTGGGRGGSCTSECDQEGNGQGGIDEGEEKRGRGQTFADCQTSNTSPPLLILLQQCKIWDLHILKIQKKLLWYFGVCWHVQGLTGKL